MANLWRRPRGGTADLGLPRPAASDLVVSAQRRRDKGGTKMQRRSFNWVALVGVALAGVVAVSATTALAARTAASPFELVFQGRARSSLSVGEAILDARLVGTFTSRCAVLRVRRSRRRRSMMGGDMVRRYTCTDGSRQFDARERTNPLHGRGRGDLDDRRGIRQLRGPAREGDVPRGGAAGRGSQGARALSRYRSTYTGVR